MDGFHPTHGVLPSMREDFQYHSEAVEIKLSFASNLASSKCLFDTYQVFELYSRMTEIENVTYENWSPN